MITYATLLVLYPQLIGTYHDRLYDCYMMDEFVKEL